MGKNNKKTDLSNLEPFNKKKGVIHVIIETTRASRNKFSYDEDLKLFRLKKVLPEGMSFPYDFGFIPSTLAEDGDPLDVLVLMDEPGAMGCLIECRILGAILGEQSTDGKKIRNDRVIAAAQPNHTHSNLKALKDLNPQLLEEIEKFFVNYHEESGAKFKVMGHCSPKEALQLVKKAIKAYRKTA